MTVLPLLAVGILMKFVAFLFVVVCFILVLVVLMQKGRGGGLSGAFSGGMASGLLGSKTGDFLTWVTIVLVSIFLFLAVLMAKFYKPTTRFGSGTATAGQQAPVGQPSAPPSGATAGQPTPTMPPAEPQSSAPSTSVPAGAQPTAGADANKAGG